MPTAKRPLASVRFAARSGMPVSLSVKEVHTWQGMQFVVVAGESDALLFEQAIGGFVRGVQQRVKVPQDPSVPRVPEKHQRIDVVVDDDGFTSLAEPPQ